MDELERLARWYIISGAIARVAIAFTPIVGLAFFSLAGGTISISGGAM